MESGELLAPGESSRASRVDEVLGPTSPLARRLPGYEHREGQLAMARAVHHALARDGHLFVEAGTGTGKTLAYLVPAILSGRKVVVSTATHALQEQIFTKDLPLVREVLAEHGVEFKAALMKGLSNYLCKRRLDERLRSGELVSADLARIERWARDAQDGDRAELVDLEEGAHAWRDVHSSTETRIGAGCTYYDECFVTRMRREAEQAQVVVVNHHLFFADLALRTGKNGGFGGAIPAYDAVIFDEAHQIESVATDFFGVRISSARLDSLVRDARRGVVARARCWTPRRCSLVDGVEQAGQHFFRAWQGAGGIAGAAVVAAAAVVARVRRATTAAACSPRATGPTPRVDALSRLDASLEALLAFAIANERDDAVTILARRAGDLRADLARIHATNQVEERHWEDGRPRRRRARARPPRASRAASCGSISASATSSLGASPVDLGPVLREKLFDRVPSVVCTSATLATATSRRAELSLRAEPPRGPRRHRRARRAVALRLRDARRALRRRGSPRAHRARLRGRVRRSRAPSSSPSPAAARSCSARRTARCARSARRSTAACRGRSSSRARRPSTCCSIGFATRAPRCSSRR